jgi:hypothetical protein
MHILSNVLPGLLIYEAQAGGNRHPPNPWAQGVLPVQRVWGLTSLSKVPINGLIAVNLRIVGKPEVIAGPDLFGGRVENPYRLGAVVGPPIRSGCRRRVEHRRDTKLEEWVPHPAIFRVRFLTF